MTRQHPSQKLYYAMKDEPINRITSLSKYKFDLRELRVLYLTLEGRSIEISGVKQIDYMSTYSWFCLLNIVLFVCH
jgi:hypothetical protein